MSNSSAVVLICVLVLALFVFTGAAIRGGGNSDRIGSFCPSGAACTHQLDHDAPALLSDAVRCAQITFDRQMTKLERATMIAAGVPAHAVR